MKAVDDKAMASVHLVLLVQDATDLAVMEAMEAAMVS